MGKRSVLILGAIYSFGGSWVGKAGSNGSDLLQCSIRSDFSFCLNFNLVFLFSSNFKTSFLYLSSQDYLKTGSTVPYLVDLLPQFHIKLLANNSSYLSRNSICRTSYMLMNNQHLVLPYCKERRFIPREMGAHNTKMDMVPCTPIGILNSKNY